MDNLPANSDNKGEYAFSLFRQNRLKDCPCDGIMAGFCHIGDRMHYLDDTWACVCLFRHMAIVDQHHYNSADFSGGVLDPECAES